VREGGCVGHEFGEKYDSEMLPGAGCWRLFPQGKGGRYLRMTAHPKS